MYSPGVVGDPLILKFSPFQVAVSPAGKPVTRGPSKPPPTAYSISTIGESSQTTWLSSVPTAEVNLINGERVPKEISSKPKSFPPAVVFRFTISIIAVVALPELQLGLDLNSLQLSKLT